MVEAGGGAAETAAVVEVDAATGGVAGAAAVAPVVGEAVMGVEPAVAAKALAVRGAVVAVAVAVAAVLAAAAEALATVATDAVMGETTKVVAGEEMALAEKERAVGHQAVDRATEVATERVAVWGTRGAAGHTGSGSSQFHPSDRNGRSVRVHGSLWRNRDD